MNQSRTQLPAPPATRTRLVDIFTSPYEAYIGGPHDGSDPRELEPGQLGFLGNPFTPGSLEDRLARFEDYFKQRMADDQRFRLAVLSLYGRRLGCFCEDERCHGEIIADWLEAHYPLYQRWYGSAPIKPGPGA